MKNISIYLAGKIKKQHEVKNETYWDDEALINIQEVLGDEFAVSFLNPAVRKDNLNSQKSVFGRDMIQVFASDFVLVDIRDRRGLGVGAEMMWAKINDIPVVCWSPKDSHYNKTKTSLLDVEVENWVHPFVESLSDLIINDLSELKEFVDNGINLTKNKLTMLEAMQFYKDNQLLNDKPMLDLLETASIATKKRVEELQR